MIIIQKNKKGNPLKHTYLNPFRFCDVEINVVKIKIGEKRFIYKFEDGFDDAYFKAKNIADAKKKYKKYSPYKSIK